MTVRRYAEGTKVSPMSSIEELQRTVERYDGDEFTFAQSPRGASAMFRLDGVPIRYDVHFPIDDDLTVKQAEQEYARRWRVIILRAKAQFEMHHSGEQSVVRAFMPDLMLEDGRTFGDVAEHDGIDQLRQTALPQLGPGGPV